MGRFLYLVWEIQIQMNMIFKINKKSTIVVFSIQIKYLYSILVASKLIILPRNRNLYVSDKQQELDLPSLRIEEGNENAGTTGMPSTQHTRSRSPRGPPMSQISGVRRPLSHTNSFTGEHLPTYGIETPNEGALGVLLGDIDTWGIDIFKIGDMSCNRPLTSIAYTIFQVTLFKKTDFITDFNAYFFLLFNRLVIL